MRCLSFSAAAQEASRGPCSTHRLQNPEKERRSEYEEAARPRGRVNGRDRRHVIGGKYKVIIIWWLNVRYLVNPWTGRTGCPK